MKGSFLVAVVVVILPVLCTCAVPGDLITNLPGYSNGTTPSPQYSGYISVDDKNGRFLHYWLVLSEGSPANDPLVIWLNGGPGCSSLDGYFYEQGPFHFVDDVAPGASIPALQDNPYRWNKIANMLFIEAPAGVGFSYSNTESDYDTNDNKTAADNLQFLLQFYKAYPEFANNKLFISGESYAGIYVPTFVYEIYLHNSAGTGVRIPLEGFMVGNGCVGNAVGNCGSDGTGNSIDFLFGHALYSPSLHDQIVKACPDPSKPSVQCYALLIAMGLQVGDVNIYDIYTPCINGMEEKLKRYGVKMSRKEMMLNSRLQRIPRRVIDDILKPEGPDECIDGISAGLYLNNDQIRSAIHVQSIAQDGQWGICTSKINYNSNIDSLLPIYPTLIQNYRTLIYNGDVDACVPYIGDEKWTSGLGFTVDQGWHQWELNGQVAGYATSYTTNGFTFITVKGSGHMVPEFRPAEAFEMFSRFLNNKPF